MNVTSLQMETFEAHTKRNIKRSVITSIFALQAFSNTNLVLMNLRFKIDLRFKI